MVKHQNLQFKREIIHSYMRSLLSSHKGSGPNHKSHTWALFPVRGERTPPIGVNKFSKYTGCNAPSHINVDFTCEKNLHLREKCVKHWVYKIISTMVQNRKTIILQCSNC